MGMPPPERQAFADKVNTTVGFLNQLAYGHKKLELGFADVLVHVADGALTLDELPLTDRALEQHRIRSSPVLAEADAKVTP